MTDSLNKCSYPFCRNGPIHPLQTCQHTPATCPKIVPYVSPATLPTPHERENLEVLLEEFLEAGKRISKLLRFGRDEIMPGQPLTNGFRLGMEIGDVFLMVRRCQKLELFTQEAINAGAANKKKQLATFMQTKGPADE